MEEEIIQSYKVYIKKDDDENIIAVNSSAFLDDVTGWTEIDSGIGDKYHHAQSNYFDKEISDANGIYVYRYQDNDIVEKTSEQINEELGQLTQYVDNILTQNDIIEMLIEQEMRILQLEEAGERDAI